MAQAVPPKTVIILAPRDEIRSAMEAELREFGVQEILRVDDRDQCVEALVRHAAAPFILDWDVGPEDANTVLRAAKGQYRVETRPMFMVIQEFTPQAVGTAADYGVSRLHAGPVSRLTIRESLQALFAEDEATREVRDTLVQVAEARARNEWMIALTLLTDLYQKMPGNERLALELAENLIHEERWTEVESMLKPLVRKDPPHVRALHLLGRAQMHAGDFAGAIDLLQKAKIINPLNVDRLIDLGNALLSEGRIQEAMTEFKDAQTQDPGNKEATVGESKCLLMSGEVNEALALLKTISGPREMASIFNTAAVLSMRREDFAKGMSLYNSALTALGQNQQLAARLHYNIGLGYRRWQKLDKASRHFSLSLELDPSFHKAKDQLDKMSTILGVKPPGASGKIQEGDSKAASDNRLRPGQPATGAKVVGDSVLEGGGNEKLAPIDWEPEE